MRLDRVMLCAGVASPPVELFVGTSMLRIPLSLPVPGLATFTNAIARRGFVALEGNGVWLVPDVGGAAAAIHGGTAWGLVPSVDDRAVLCGYEHSVELVTLHGIQRSVALETGEVPVGQLETGEIVTTRAIVGWDGRRRALPAGERAVAVLNGRRLVVVDGTTLCVFDAEAPQERHQLVELPAPPRHMFASPSYRSDLGAAIVTLADWTRVVVRGNDAHILDVAGLQGTPAWIDHRLLVTAGDAHFVADLDSGSREPIEGPPPHVSPLLDVTGRYDPAALLAGLRPGWSGPIPARERKRLERQARQEVASLAARANVSARKLLRNSAPAIRLRPFVVESDLPIGASRLGGVPDLPASHGWPRYDGRPMTFLAQLRCDELKAAMPGERSLPSDGWLVVFVALEPDGNYPPDDDAVRCRYLSDQAVLRMSWPDDLPASQRWDVEAVAAVPMLSLPWLELDRLFDGDDFEAILQAEETIRPVHQVFGHPSSANDWVFEEREFVLTIDSDSQMNTAFGPCGSLHITRPFGTLLEGLEQCAVELETP